MDSLHTKLCNILSVDTPIIAAPMAGASGGALAAHVSLASGFGFIAAGYDTLPQFEYQISLAREILQHPADKSSPLSVGVGFLGWQLELPESPAVYLLTAALNNRVKAVWFAFGEHLGHWVRLVREYDAAAESEHKTVIFVQVSSLQEALIAINEWKVDVIVAQGIESGGHGHSQAPPLATLTADILFLENPHDCLVLAAGGISNGKEIADYIRRGCAGVVLGTRFLLTPQSLYSASQKNALVAATGASATVRTTAFDELRGTTGWPAKIDGRCLYNETVKDYDRDGFNEALVEEFRRASRDGNPTRMLIWAGTGIGSMFKIQDAKEVVSELRAQCLEAFESIV